MVWRPIWLTNALVGDPLVSSYGLGLESNMALGVVAGLAGKGGGAGACRGVAGFGWPAAASKCAWVWLRVSSVASCWACSSVSMCMTLSRQVLSASMASGGELDVALDLGESLWSSQGWVAGYS